MHAFFIVTVMYAHCSTIENNIFFFLQKFLPSKHCTNALFAGKMYLYPAQYLTLSQIRFQFNQQLFHVICIFTFFWLINVLKRALQYKKKESAQVFASILFGTLCVCIWMYKYESVWFVVDVWLYVCVFVWFVAYSHARHRRLSVKVFFVAAIWRLHSESDGGRISKSVLDLIQSHFK